MHIYLRFLICFCAWPLTETETRNAPKAVLMHWKMAWLIKMPSGSLGVYEVN